MNFDKKVRMFKEPITLFLCLLLYCLIGASVEGVNSRVGDWVYSYDTITGEVSQQQVTATYVLESNHINYLTIIDEDGNEQVIEATDAHPFWVLTDDPDFSRGARDYAEENGVVWHHEGLDGGEYGYWVEAKDLQVGDVFMGANGELSTLVAAERVVFPAGIKVYNFTVDGNHNYFIIAETGAYGQTSILVHNAKLCGADLVNAGKAGEVKAGITKNTERFFVNGKWRIPDEVTGTMITEVKDVAKQSLTRQIKDYLKLAKDLKTGFTLIVREGDNTKLSKPLLGKKTAGEIILKQILPNP